MYELKRISLGEFLDGLEYGDKIASFFGISSSKDDAVDDKAGDDRVGSESFMDNFGVSFILFLIVFVVVITTVLGIVYYIKRHPCS